MCLLLFSFGTIDTERLTLQSDPYNIGAEHREYAVS